MQIYKYTVAPSDKTQKLYVPRGTRIVSLGEDGNGDLCVWAEVGYGEDNHISYAIVGTGWSFRTSGLEFKQTVVMSSGLVFHLYTEEED